MRKTLKFIISSVTGAVLLLSCVHISASYMEQKPMNQEQDHTLFCYAEWDWENF